MEGKCLHVIDNNLKIYSDSVAFVALYQRYI